MKNTSEHIIIDDGQFRFPIRRASLGVWTKESISADYEGFCEAVLPATDHVVGGPDCIAYCRALEDAGAEVWLIA